MLMLFMQLADESRPAEAFTTERAVRNGRANAASGRIMVNVPNDHFGPILPEHDPVNAKVGPARRHSSLTVVLHRLSAAAAVDTPQCAYQLADGSSLHPAVP